MNGILFLIFKTECFFSKLIPAGFSGLIHYKNYNSNWKKILGFRDMQEKLENTPFITAFFYQKSKYAPLFLIESKHQILREQLEIW